VAPGGLCPQPGLACGYPSPVLGHLSAVGPAGPTHDAQLSSGHGSPCVCAGGPPPQAPPG
jgi:hypothetical protein